MKDDTNVCRLVFRNYYTRECLSVEEKSLDNYITTSYRNAEFFALTDCFFFKCVCVYIHRTCNSCHFTKGGGYQKGR